MPAAAPAPGPGGVRPDVPPAPGRDPADEAERIGRQERVFAAWSSLAPQDRHLTWLELVERRTPAEIAVLVDLPQAGVAAATGAARAALRRAYERCGPTSGARVAGAPGGPGRGEASATSGRDVGG